MLNQVTFFMRQFFSMHKFFHAWTFTMRTFFLHVKYILKKFHEKKWLCETMRKCFSWVKYYFFQEFKFLCETKRFFFRKQKLSEFFSCMKLFHEWNFLMLECFYFIFYSNLVILATFYFPLVPKSQTGENT